MLLAHAVTANSTVHLICFRYTSIKSWSEAPSFFYLRSIQRCANALIHILSVIELHLKSLLKTTPSNLISSTTSNCSPSSLIIRTNTYLWLHGHGLLYSKRKKKKKKLKNFLSKNHVPFLTPKDFPHP